MRNLRLTVLTMVLLTAPFFGQAQEKSKPKKDRYEALKMKLDLNDEQIEKIKAIDAKYEAQRKELKAKIEPLQKELKALKEERKASKKAQATEMEGVFTPEQAEQFKEMRKNHMEKKRRKAAEHK